MSTYTYMYAETDIHHFIQILNFHMLWYKMENDINLLNDDWFCCIWCMSSTWKEVSVKMHKTFKNVYQWSETSLILLGSSEVNFIKAGYKGMIYGE